MKIELPNLRVMIHYYTSAAHLFKTVTMYTGDQNDRILDEIAASNAWFGGRFAAGHRERYMEKRRFVEARMYEQFEQKYGAPRTCRPVYFYIRPYIDLEAIDRDLLQRRAYGETRTEYLLLGVDEIADRREIGFTLFDSHRSFDAAYAEATSERRESPSSLPDEGTVFRIDEITDVFARNSDVDGLYFEVQVWDPDVLKGARVQRTSL